MKQKNYRRGYPVAILIGTEQSLASLWQIYSQVAKHQQTIHLKGYRNDQKTLYNYHEEIINAIRPTIREGVKNIIVSAPPRATFAQDLIDHIKAHHSWLMRGENRASISKIAGNANSAAQVSTLTATSEFKELIEINAEEETSSLLQILEKKLNSPKDRVIFSLEQVEKTIFENTGGDTQVEYFLMTDNYVKSNRQKSRVNRLMQIANNKKIKTRVINADSTAGSRLSQLGGIVCLLKD